MLPYYGEDRLGLSVEIVFSYDGHIQHQIVGNAVAGCDQPVGVEERGATGRRAPLLLQGHHPGVLVDLSVLPTNHSLERVPGPTL